MDNTDIYQQLDRILSSPMFADAGRLQRFLTYIVEHTLSGAPERLKGYTLGVEVFDRPGDFDPAVDSIVRVEAGRLRAKLREYYDGPGAADPITFSIPKGSYVVQIETRASATQRQSSVGVPLSPPPNSIAVLPIVSLSADPEQGYFADGMTDAIINRLGRNGALRVTSFTSAMCFKDSRKPMGEIADALHVKYIVEGTCLPASDRARVTSQLIDAVSDTHVWADRYDLDLGDVLVTQDEVAERISIAMGSALKVHIGETRGHKVDPLAYEANLQGRRYRMQLTEEGLSKAIECFQRAIDIDPEFSEPYAGIAGCYCSFGTFGVELRPPHEVIPNGMAIARKGVELDESLVEARAFLGIMMLKYGWDWPGAAAEFERALAINPSDVRCLLQFGLYFETIADFPRAIDYAERAYVIDPFNKGVQLNCAWQHNQSGDAERALDRVSRLVAAEPGFWGGHWVLGHVLRDLGQYDGARAAFATAVELPGGNTLPLEGFGHCCAVMGLHAEAGEALAELERIATLQYVSPYRLATIYAGLGDRDAMYEGLERAFEMRTRSLAWIGVAHEYEPYRGEGRFQSLVERIGIPLKASGGGPEQNESTHGC